MAAERAQPDRQTAPNFNSALDLLRAAGFQVTRDGDRRARLQKGRCGAVLEDLPDGRLRFADPPGYIIAGHISRLEDGGYQKFLITPSLKIPALAEHLKEVHRFAGEVRAALGVHTLYNEALGTVSDVYLYDRVKGRAD